VARKATGGKPGRPKGNAARDHFVFGVVEWVMLRTGRPLGRGTVDDETSSGASACTIAAWLLSGGSAYSQHLTEAERRCLGWDWVFRSAGIVREMQVLGIGAGDNFNLSPSAVRDSYTRVKALPHWRDIPAIRDLPRWQQIAGASADPYLPGDGEGFPPQDD
jgi:hypothetical protein